LVGLTSAFFSTLAGADAGVAGALAGSAANTDTADNATRVAIILFMLFPLRLILN
jgi:hypothetical protein